MKELAPGATGWLGQAPGAASNGTFFAAVRFESADPAKANSDRSEQRAWWQETTRCLEGRVPFADCGDVERSGAEAEPTTPASSR